MRKRVLFLAILLLLPIISAIELDVSTKPISNTVITDLNEPAVFDLTIRNLGETDNFEIYSLVGVDIAPQMTGIINSGNSSTFRIEVLPQSALQSRKGFFTFEYRIKDSKNDIQKETLTLNIADLSSSFSIEPKPITPKSEEITIDIKNKVMKNFPELKIKMSSAFFENEEVISLESLGSHTLTIPIDKDKIKILSAGQFLMNTRIESLGKIGTIESIIKFLEQEDIEITENKEGIIITRTELIKKNIGNIRKTTSITSEKNLISFLFTTTNIPPTSRKISGFIVRYNWEKDLIPNEELKVILKTNWFFPIIIILLIFGIITAIRKTIDLDLQLRKQVSFVKTKGGQFALKVTLRLKSKTHLDKIRIIDKMPPLVNLYEKFGSIHPDKIDLKNRRIEWDLQSLNEDEERIFSYIIYSKVGIIGRFELPEARAIYEKEGKIKYATSNRSFFINEPSSS